MRFKCPGSQSFSQPHPEFINCTHCGKEMEVWSDEIKATCQSCKKDVLRDQEQNCLGWCKYAKECVGEKAYKKYVRNKNRGVSDDKPKDAKSPKRTIK